MVDPRIAVAMSVQARKGVYALLLGSGVSTAAGIPTGWGVVTDLCRRIAALTEKAPPADPVRWYIDTHGREPTYSELLRAIGKQPGDRSNILRDYFVPTAEERESELKVPTAAHHAIARLAADGVFRVILTTNFDSLIEDALAVAGLQPRVIANTAAIEGATPLQHAECTVIKVHGDYRDLATRNTTDELATYEQPLNILLDRVLSEYGLIVCGWSGEWDQALRDAIIRNTRFRYSTYWLAKGTLSARGEHIVRARDATVITIDAADEFFADHEQRVRSIGQSRVTHPASVEMAAATVKRLVARPDGAIVLADQVFAAVKEVRQRTRVTAFPLSYADTSHRATVARAEQYEAIAAPLAHMLFAGCRWGTDEHKPIWTQAIERAAMWDPAPGGAYYRKWEYMQSLPACYCMYSAGLGAMAADNYKLLLWLFRVPQRLNEQNQKEPVICVSSADSTFQGATPTDAIVTNHIAHGSEWMYRRLKQFFADEFGDERLYTEAFHRFEVLQTMVMLDLNDEGKSCGYVANGRYMWQREYMPHQMMAELEEGSPLWLSMGFARGGDRDVAARHLRTIEQDFKRR